MRTQSIQNRYGVSLIELLVALAICGMVMAGSYRFFVSQSKAYVLQDQVIEAQQSLRLAMETLSRDLRMAGFDDDGLRSTITITEPIVGPLRDDAITLSYEYYDKKTSQYQEHKVTYWREIDPPRLVRQLTIDDVANPAEVLLEYVRDFKLSYGINPDGNSGTAQWVSADKAAPNRVTAVRVVLSTIPAQVNSGERGLSPRTLTSVVALRNLCSKR